MTSELEPASNGNFQPGESPDDACGRSDADSDFFPICATSDVIECWQGAASR